MASPTKGRSRGKARSRARGASVGAILGAASAILQVGCGIEEEPTPSVDHHARPDARPDGGVLAADAEIDGSTLVDLDGEADAVPADGSAQGAPEGGGGGDAEVS